MLDDCAAYVDRVTAVREILEGKWKLQILCAMRDQPVRMSQLTRQIPSASKKALRAGLRSLELSRVIVRHDMSSAVLHVEYDFTDDMREYVTALLDHLAEWGASLKQSDDASE
jgi:DNA-binding HxlR family transcriptional regulator